ncbi:hypothetical protein GF373_11120 [bacterium]|nr:hypothetical protein [bacterium]
MTKKKMMMWIGILVVLIVYFWFTWPTRDRYISDMEISVLKAEWSKPSLDTTIDGNPIQIDGKTYTKGIGVHANSELSVQVPGGYTHFVAEVGVDDEIQEEKPASVIFQVLGDGAVLYESPILTSDKPPYRICVNIQQVNQLVLSVSGGEDGNIADHADWGLARFTNF